MYALHRLWQHAMIEHDDVDPGARVVRKIALALGVSADTLLGIKQELEKVGVKDHSEDYDKAE
jgi:transcriptional regulator with XRE-family HTH domain